MAVERGRVEKTRYQFGYNSEAVKETGGYNRNTKHLKNTPVDLSGLSSEGLDNIIDGSERQLVHRLVPQLLRHLLALGRVYDGRKPITRNVRSVINQLINQSTKSKPNCVRKRDIRGTRHTVRPFRHPGTARGPPRRGSRRRPRWPGHRRRTSGRRCGRGCRR